MIFGFFHRVRAALAFARRESHLSIREDGSSFVELVIILPVVLLLVGAIVDFSFYLREQNTLLKSASEAGREASLLSSTANSYVCPTSTSNCVTQPSKADEMAYIVNYSACNNRPTSSSIFHDADWRIESQCFSRTENSTVVKMIRVTISENSRTACLFCWRGWAAPDTLSGTFVFPLR